VSSPSSQRRAASFFNFVLASSCRTIRAKLGDNRAIFTAAGYAEATAGFLHGLHPEAETTAEADDV
jgi:antirestriction protein ArdC